MPTDASVDMKDLCQRLRGAFGGELREVVEKPVAFGLVSLEAIIIMDDVAGQLDQSEEVIRGLGDIGSVETVSVDLI